MQLGLLGDDGLTYCPTDTLEQFTERRPFSEVWGEGRMLLALSMLVVYIYGSMVWGMFPFADIHVSWEAHMMGAIAGFILAFWYRKEGPQRPEPEWLDDDDQAYDDDTLISDINE